LETGFDYPEPTLRVFTKITGIEPVDIKTFADLDDYIAQCKRHFWGVSQETKFLHWLIDRERGLCMGGR